MSDQLKKIAQERDVNTFRHLYLTFGPKVKAMMLRQGADRETADEIVQETMLAVWRKSHLFTERKGSISTWIFTIARNLRIDRVRRQIVWQGFCENFETPPSGDEPADEQLAREQEREQVGSALASLPAEQLQIIKLSFEDGLTQSEIAGQLNLPLGTVKSRMRLAYDKLRGSVGRCRAGAHAARARQKVQSQTGRMPSVEAGFGEPRAMPPQIWALPRQRHGRDEKY